jgi:hypothetical protein
VKRTDQVTAVLLLVGSVAYALAAVRRYEYWALEGPGSGFLPFWLGLAMAVLAALLLVTSTRGRGPARAWLPTGHGRQRLVVVIAATAVLIAVLPAIGMIVGIALFLVTILRFVERYSWRLTMSVAAATAAGCWLLFSYWLGVPFPTGPLGF